jgi:dTDP-4-dehydrorhamnose reductase
MRLLVTGTSGQLAQSLLEAGHEAGIDVIAIRRPQFDLTVPGTIRAALIDAAPDIVVNAAAYTAVDKAESEPELAHAVNATGSEELARQCEAQGIALVHISTDYVFDGTKHGRYVEDDATGPANAYGRSKLAGEIAVAAACARHVILRTSWVHSPFGANFVKTMLRLAESRPEIRVVDDQWGSPTYAPHLARAVLAVARQLPGRDDGPGRLAPWGVFHAAGGGETTWCRFAREIFRVSVELGGPSARVEAITTSDYPTPAKRPGNSRLDCGKLARVLGVTLPDWRLGARVCVERLLAARG